MGLYVHSIAGLSADLDREYYIYILDNGFEEPLSKVLHTNFRRMAELAAQNNAVVIAGTNSRKFAQEVFSLHIDDAQFSYRSINGENGDSILPAMMITTIHPNKFRETQPGYRFSSRGPGTADDKLVLIPLRSFCKNETEVMTLVERIFEDLHAQKPLTGFSVAKDIQAAGKSGAYSDALILRPALWGMGVDIKELLKNWRSKGGSRSGANWES